jgi:adenylate cyclase
MMVVGDRMSRNEPLWLGRYALVRPLRRSGPGRAFLARVATDGAPLPRGTQVQCRAVHGPDELLDELRDAHKQLEGVREIRSICPPIDYGIEERDGERVFVSACPWVEGRPLSAVLREVRRFPDPLTEALAADLGAAIVAIHETGLTGIGMSPQTLFLSQDSVVTLMDPAFGPAVVASWPERGRVPASLRCAAPELLRETPEPGARADLYALGAVLYRCVTGRWHRSDRNVQQLRRNVVTPLEKRPRGFKSRCSLFLDRVIATLLEPSPEARLESAEALARVLAERRSSDWWRAQEPTSTHKTELPEEPSGPMIPTAPTVPHPAPPPDAAWLADRGHALPPSTEHPAPCVGQDTFLKLLEDMLHGISPRRGQVILVEGEAGMGKTRMVDAFRERARELDLDNDPIIIAGEYHRLGIGRPLRAFSDGLARWLGSGTVSIEDVERLLGEASGIAASFTALLNGEAPPEGPISLKPESLTGAFARVIRALCQHGPLVLIIENLQWAEPEGLDLFGYLARIAATLPVVLIGTHRPVPEGGPASALLMSVRSLERCTTLRVDPLGPADTVNLVREIVRPELEAEELGGRLFSTSQGVPLLVVQSLRCLEDEGYLASGEDGFLHAGDDMGSARLPVGEFAVLERRLSRLGRNERELLDIAAVQGVAFDARVTASALGRRFSDTQRSLRRLVKRGFLFEGRTTYRFVSHAVFDHIHDGLADADLENAHEKTAKAFLEHAGAPDRAPVEREGMRAFRVAWHSLMASRVQRGLLHVRAALRYLCDSWRLGEADRLVHLACRELEDENPRDRARLIDLLLLRAEILALQGRREEERAAVDDALAAARSIGDRVREARSLLQSTQFYLDTGKHRRAKREGREALALATRSGETWVASRCHALLGRVAFLEARYQQAREHLKRVVELAREHEDSASEAAALRSLANISQDVGSVAHAEELHLEAMRIYRRSGDLTQEAETLASLGEIAAAQGDLEQAEAHLERALAIHRALGDGYGQARVLADLGAVQLDAGRPSDAREIHTHCLEVSRDMGMIENEVAALVNIGIAQEYLGQLDEARGNFSDAMRSSREFQDARLEGYALRGLGEMARQKGEWDIARDLFHRAIDCLESVDDPGGLSAALLGAGRAELMVGDELEAFEFLERAIGEPDSRQMRIVNALCMALRALALARRHKSEEAHSEIAHAGAMLKDFPKASLPRVEVRFLHSLVLRVLGLRTQADRALVQADQLLKDALRTYPAEARARLRREVSPYREISAAVRHMKKAPPPAEHVLSDTAPA